MWGNRKRKVTRIDSLIGQHTEIHGDITFSGGLHVDGKVEGNIVAPTESSSVLTLSEQGYIKGEVRVPNVILNGKVIGNVYAEEHVELALNARIIGNVYYNLIEMAMGAEVNGSLIHASNMTEQPALPIGYEKTGESKTSSKGTREEGKTSA